MFALVGGMDGLRRRAARRRARRTVQQVGGGMGTLRKRIGDAFVVKEAERLARSAARTAPVVGRRRGPGRAAAMAPAVVLAGLVATAGLLLWDERRRAA